MAPDEFLYTSGMVEEILLGDDSEDLDHVEYAVDVRRAWSWYQKEYPTASVLVQARIVGYTDEDIVQWKGMPLRDVLATLYGAYRVMATWLNGDD